MKHEHRLTSKGQVTIPKDIRDALGLEPGEKVRFELDSDGNARIVKVDRGNGVQDWMRRLEEARASYKPLPEFAGMDGLDYQRWIRPDRIEP